MFAAKVNEACPRKVARTQPNSTLVFEEFPDSLAESLGRAPPDLRILTTRLRENFDRSGQVLRDVSDATHGLRHIVYGLSDDQQ